LSRIERCPEEAGKWEVGGSYRRVVSKASEELRVAPVKNPDQQEHEVTFPTPSFWLHPEQEFHSRRNLSGAPAIQ
jgi:hypothetical protein